LSLESIKYLYRPVFSAVFFQLLIALNCEAQGFSIQLENRSDQISELPYKAPQFALDSADALEKLRKYRSGLIEAGYLLASIDSVEWSEKNVSGKLYPGDQYRWANLGSGNVPEEYLSELGFNERIRRKEPLSPKNVRRLMEGVISLSENRGFPFAKVKLDSLEIEANQLKATLNLERESFVRIDTLIIKGDIKTNKTYLKNYLGIKSNTPYNQALLNKIPTRLKELPFVRVIKPYEIGMRPGKADVYLYLDNKKASNFDGVLGILPDNETGEILITGDVKLNLVNSLKRGETINFQWQRLQTRTSQLDLRFEYPFIFGTPIGVETSLELYRRDTLFSQVNSHLGLQYYFNGINNLNLYYENDQANVISTAIFDIDQFVDSRINKVGLGLDITDLDYRFNPRKGYFADGSFAAGIRRINQNPDLDESLYDGIDLVSDILTADLDAGVFVPLGNRSTLYLGTKGGMIINDNVFRNEMYRIGGLKTLRGFDEQSIFASRFAIATAEYRFILEQNSNLFLFFDQGWYEDRIGENSITDSPFGFGGGINFETNAGVFSLTYALGKQFDNAIEIRSGKIHFGFISFF
jgi:outer membrane protein assembly factor BamA